LKQRFYEIESLSESLLEKNKMQSLKPMPLVCAIKNLFLHQKTLTVAFLQLCDLAINKIL